MNITRLASAMAIATSIACSSPTAPEPANIAGSYDLTITASSNCSTNLPSETRVLKYIATVTQTGASVQATLLGHVIWNTVTVTGTVSGQTVTFASFSFSEITTGGGIALTSSGTANVATDGSITGTLNGNYLTPAGTNCNAANHQIQMVKK